VLASAPDLYYSSYCLRGGSIEPETFLEEPSEPDPVRTGVGIGHPPLFPACSDQNHRINYDDLTENNA
jgi:hypothetical protein